MNKSLDAALDTIDRTLIANECDRIERAAAEILQADLLASRCALTGVSVEVEHIKASVEAIRWSLR